MITTTEVPTFTATIWVSVEQSHPEEFDPQFTIADVRDVTGNYCNRVGLCVTITQTGFVYTGGGEYGFAIGLINYPRFPSTPEAISGHAVALAELLLVKLRQRRVSVVFPDRTVMLSNSDAPASPPEGQSPPAPRVLPAQDALRAENTRLRESYRMLAKAAYIVALRLDEEVDWDAESDRTGAARNSIETVSEQVRPWPTNEEFDKWDPSYKPAVPAPPETPVGEREGDLERLLKAADDLCFECDGVLGTRAPSIATYNRVFDVIAEIKKKVKP